MGLGIAALALLSGIGRGRAATEERKQKDAMIKAQVKLFDSQLRNTETAAGAKQQLLDMLVPKAPVFEGGTEISPAQPGQTIQQLLSTPQGQAIALRSGVDLSEIQKSQQPGITDLLSQLTSGAGGDRADGLGVTGIDVRPTGSTVKFGFPNREFLDIGDRKLEIVNGQFTGNEFPIAQEFRTIETVGSEGQRSRVQVPQFVGGNQGSGATGGGIPTAISPLDEPLSPSELLNFRLPGGKTLPPGTTLRQARTLGAIPSSASEQSIEISQRGATAVLDRLDELSDKVFREGGSVERALAAPEQAFNFLTQNDPDLVLLFSFTQGTVAPLIRSLGEKGSLADRDVSRAINLLPRLFPVPDSRTVAKGKLKQIREILRRAGGGEVTEKPTQGPDIIIDFEELPP